MIAQSLSHELSMNFGKTLAPRFACSDYGGDAQQDHTEFEVNSIAVENTSPIFRMFQILQQKQCW